MSIKLYTQPDGQVFEKFEESKLDLKAEEDFKQAVVTSGTWIFYSYKNNNEAQAGGNGTNHKILYPGEKKDISKVNGSMYLVPDEVEGFILFKHNFYGGKNPMHYVESCADVNQDFPPEAGGGVSSVIILSKNENFVAYKRPGFDGVSVVLRAGQWYPRIDETGFKNDAMRSIRKE